MLWSSAAASSVTDNIPLAVMLAKTIEPMAIDPSGVANPEFQQSYWWAIIYGANLGGNITPIGSASTVVAVTVNGQKRHQDQLSPIHQKSNCLCFGAIGAGQYICVDIELIGIPILLS